MMKYLENAVGMFSKQGLVPAQSSGSSLTTNSHDNYIRLTSNKIDIIMKRTEVILRLGVVIMALVSAVIVGVASQTEQVFGLHKTANFILIKALIYLVITEGILAGYSLLQGLRCISGMYTGSILLSKPLAWMIFSCDQVMAYVSLAAAASAAESAYLAEKGQTELQWIKVCVFFTRFCWQIGGGIVIGFFAAGCMVVLSGMSAYHLFRLYGKQM